MAEEPTPQYFPGAHVATQPDKPALILAGSGDTVTFAELDASANRLARTFRALGLEVEDHIAVCMENRVELPQVAWGAHYAGLNYTFASTRLTPGELAYIVEDSGSGVLVLSDTLAATNLEPLRELLSDVVIVTVGKPVDGTDNLFDVASAQSGEPIPGAVEGADMLYSSGTTGRPKGVKRPFGGKPLGSTATVGLLGQLLLNMGSDSVYLSPAPMYHAAPLRWTMDAIALGGTGVIMEHFDAEGVLAAIDTHGVTHAQFVPTMFIRMLRLPLDVKARYDVSTLQAAIHAAAPCPPIIKREMLDWWGPKIYEYYAGTEGQG